MFLSGIPVKVAAPAAAAALAYLNARWSVSYDINLAQAFVSLLVYPALKERSDRLNLFYTLEQYANDSKMANHPFIVYERRTWTFREGYETVLRYGNWFRTVHGVKPKEIVAMNFLNSSTFIFMWFGLWSIGAVPAFINYNLLGKPLTHSVKTSTSRLLLVDPEVKVNFPKEELDLFASPDFRDGKGSVEVVFFTPEVEAQVLQTPPVRAPDSTRTGAIRRDMAILIYTSGTTGLPKAAVVSWGKCYAGGVFSSRFPGLRKSDRFYTVSFKNTLWVSAILPADPHISLCLFTIPPLQSCASVLVYMLVPRLSLAADFRLVTSGKKFAPMMRQLYSTWVKPCDTSLRCLRKSTRSPVRTSIRSTMSG